MKIIVFTDIHLQADNGDATPNPYVSLTRGLDHVARFNADADLLVFCGDLAHSGDRRSYEQLHELLAGYETLKVLMIGNHDRREEFQAVFTDEPTDENGFVQRVIDTAQHRLIFLDTLNAPPYDYPQFHFGRLCKDRINWLENALAGAGERNCVLFMHHPPHDVNFVAMDALKLANGAEFYKVVERAGNVEQIICGHVHRTISGSHRGIPFSIFKSTVGQTPMLFDVMDFKMETLEPAAYGIVILGENGVNVHTEDYGLSDLTALQAQASSAF